MGIISGVLGAVGGLLGGGGGGGGGSTSSTTNKTYDITDNSSKGISVTAVVIGGSVLLVFVGVMMFLVMRRHNS